MKTEQFNITNEDNMKLMSRYEDNYFDLAIVDPPYGINAGKVGKYCTKNKKEYTPKEWDNSTPNDDYFNELMRVSKNQIIWGGNYYANKLPNSRCWIFWDKLKEVDNYADGELCWTSFDKNTKKFIHRHHGFLTSDNLTIHPTQKPVKLYEWLFKNYAKENDKILDTHLGSGSIAIALDRVNKLDKMNLHLTACELDKDYFDAATDRIEKQTIQQTLF